MPKTFVDIAVEHGQECLKKWPVIVLGSGASIPFGLPSMKELACRLIQSKPGNMSNGQDSDLWKCFVSKLQTHNLEDALMAINLSEPLYDHIIEQTWMCIRTADKKVFERIMANEILLPLTRLYRHLFGSTHRKLSIVTTNYDRLAEYAADRAGYCHYTGFTYGYFCQLQTHPKLSFIQDGQLARTVDIWKVHGCLDWFTNTDNHVIALRSADSIPTSCRPAIVTPGIKKYEQTHGEPFRSIITGADAALTNAAAYLCIGFGFNDQHIQPKLMERWRQGEALLVVLTRTLSDSAKSMLGKSDGRRFLALEKMHDGTRMWSHHHPKGEFIENVQLWNFPDFLNSTI